jgi:flagella basal body P-ring formation protein FlgA
MRWIPLAASTLVLAGAAAAARPVPDLIRETLSAAHPGARVEVLELAAANPAQSPSEAESVSLLQAPGRGEARLVARLRNGAAEYRARYAAFVPAMVPIRRVLPGEALSGDVLVRREVNIAEGLANELRGILLPVGEDLSRLEARQTLVEGAFVTTTAVRRTPDLRRGDAVRVDVVTGDVRLSAQAMALEPAAISQRVRVQTMKTRRELVGVLREGGVVEVRL